MTSGRSTAVLVSIVAGVLAVIAFTAGQLNGDAILRASATGLLVLCFVSALRAFRRRRASEVSGSDSTPSGP